MLYQDSSLILPDKFEYSHYLSAEECMGVVGRSFMLITSGR